MDSLQLRVGGFFVSFGLFCCEVFVALYTPCMLCGALPFANICVYLSKKKKILARGGKETY